MIKKNKINMITMHLINNFLYSLVDEMTASVVRTSFSPLARDAFDFQCGICNGEGDIILEGEGSMLHSLAYKYVIKSIKEKFEGSIMPGDVYLDNDPYSEASHLPDIYLARPIFHDDRVIAWSVSGGHMIDVGGRIPGSCACDSTEIYQEGLRIPPVKLYSGNKPLKDIFDIIRANSRVPDVLVGDISAHVAACRTGEKRFLELVNEYGWDTLELYLEELIDYSERRTREDLKALPNGIYEFTDYLDDDGFGSDIIPIKLKITKSGDTITYDFTGTAPQIKGSMNNPLSTTKSMVLIGLRCLINPDIPRNSGVWRPVNLIVPKGSILNPTLPAAVAGRGLTLSRTIDVIMGAEAKISPDKIPACEMGSDFLLCMAFYEGGIAKSILVETIWGGWGGRPFADGIDFNTPVLLDGANQSCELNESLYPIIFKKYGYVEDTEGAGKYRGSLGVVRQWEISEGIATAQIRTDRTKTRPWGLNGGQPGSYSKTLLISGGSIKELSKATVEMKKGDILSVQVSGAGGWGDPYERDVEMVMNDLLNEKITLDRAKNTYGVVFKEDSLEIDSSATQKLREQSRKQDLHG